MTLTRNCNPCGRVMPEELEHIEVTLEKIKVKLVPVDPNEDICGHCVKRVFGRGVLQSDLKLKEKEVRKEK